MWKYLFLIVAVLGTSGCAATTQSLKLPEVPAHLMQSPGQLVTADDDTPDAMFAAHRHNMGVCGVGLARHGGLSRIVQQRQRILDEGL